MSPDQILPISYIEKRALKSLQMIGSIRLHDSEYSETVLIRLSQAEYFSKEIDSLKRGKPLQCDSSILSLNLFLACDGILHIEGRLDNADISFEQPYPLLLYKINCHASSPS